MRRNIFIISLLAISFDCAASLATGDLKRKDDLIRGSTRAYLEQTINQALAYSPEIKVADADSSAAHYDIDQVKGQRWPQVQLGTTAPMASFGSGAAPGQRRPGDSSLAVSVTTTLFDWGRNSESIDGATQQAKASVHQYNYTRQQIAYSTVNELIDLSRYRQNQDITLRYVERMRELVNMLNEITKTDRGRYSELVQARAKLLAAETALQRVREQLRQSEIKLSRLTGQPVTLPKKFDWTMRPILPSLVMSRLANHPSLLKAQAESSAAEHQAAAVKAGSLPQINWVVSKNTAKDSYGNDEQWYTGVNVQWNIFSGGSDKAAILASSARASASKSQYTQSRMDMEYQIKNLTLSRDTAEMQAREYKKLSQETDKVSKIYYEQWLRLGKRTLLDVLTAENDRYNNHIAAVNAEHDVYSNNITLIAMANMLFEWLNIHPR
ncbi:MAG: TolC family protein [Enterobacterales bacterium endosymbiont of Blomia tropicalis]|uniref:TolC family protein n=1 Tax=Mixta mediterraneensis TaxID=2758443 RepID=UPI0025A7F887|nr:TolC family protein [Mixta mediterraneensis]MDL4915143.1 TolC family protein [Mixta mediterraneensis]